MFVCAGRPSARAPSRAFHERRIRSSLPRPAPAPRRQRRRQLRPSPSSTRAECCAGCLRCSTSRKSLAPRGSPCVMYQGSHRVDVPRTRAELNSSRTLSASTVRWPEFRLGDGEQHGGRMASSWHPCMTAAPRCSSIQPSVVCSAAARIRNPG